MYNQYRNARRGKERRAIERLSVFRDNIMSENKHLGQN